MIISASYKTDIPTFYGEWFMNRLRAGYCKIVNPYNRSVLSVPLDRDHVDGIVFWTKNVAPFLKHLPAIHNAGYSFVLQHTINGYPRALEKAVVDSTRAIENLRQVARDFGPRVCVWRYDPIVESSLTPRSVHIQTFSRIASQLEGATDEVVISFAHLYRKTLRRMNEAAEAGQFAWKDPPSEWKAELASDLAAIAARSGIKLSICSQPQFVGEGCAEARCVDAQRLSDIAGASIKAVLKGNRKECGCYESRDIGEYDTCPHGCVYCYAVQDQSLAARRFQIHDPTSETLFPISGRAVAIKQETPQRKLFDD